MTGGRQLLVMASGGIFPKSPYFRLVKHVNYWCVYIMYIYIYCRVYALYIEGYIYIYIYTNCRVYVLNSKYV